MKEGIWKTVSRLHRVHLVSALTSTEQGVDLESEGYDFHSSLKGGVGQRK